MAETRYVYVTYIRTSPERLWQALLEPDFTQKFWYASTFRSDWTKDGPWEMHAPHGSVVNSGQVLEIDAPVRLVLSWQVEFDAELRGEGRTQVTFELEPQGESTRLTITHESDRDDSKLVRRFSGGWPLLMSSLKSLLETGESLVETRAFPRGR